MPSKLKTALGLVGKNLPPTLIDSSKNNAGASKEEQCGLIFGSESEKPVSPCGVSTAAALNIPQRLFKGSPITAQILRERQASSKRATVPDKPLLKEESAASHLHLIRLMTIREIRKSGWRPNLFRG